MLPFVPKFEHVEVTLDFRRHVQPQLFICGPICSCETLNLKVKLTALSKRVLLVVGHKEFALVKGLLVLFDFLFRQSQVGKHALQLFYLLEPTLDF